MELMSVNAWHDEDYTTHMIYVFHLSPGAKDLFVISVWLRYLSIWARLKNNSILFKCFKHEAPPSRKSSFFKKEGKKSGLLSGSDHCEHTREAKWLLRPWIAKQKTLWGQVQSILARRGLAARGIFKERVCGVSDFKCASHWECEFCLSALVTLYDVKK